MSSGNMTWHPIKLNGDKLVYPNRARKKASLVIGTRLVKTKLTEPHCLSGSINFPGGIMRFQLSVLAVFILTFAVAGVSQNSMKLFDEVAIGAADTSVPWWYSYAVSFRTTEVYLSCPNNRAEAILTGPDGGNLIVDNFLAMNGDNVCPMGRCFAGTFAAPQLGHSVEDAYYGIAPLDVSDLLVGSGVYKFELKDYGYSLGSTEVHLQTNCLLEPASQICHRNFGNKGNRTLSVAESAVAAHLAHGDTAGPCIDE